MSKAPIRRTRRGSDDEPGKGDEEHVSSDVFQMFERYLNEKFDGLSIRLDAVELQSQTCDERIESKLDALTRQLESKEVIKSGRWWDFKKAVIIAILSLATGVVLNAILNFIQATNP